VARTHENHCRSSLWHRRPFLGAYNWLARPGAKLDKRQKEFLRDQTFHGHEIVPNKRRMCLMNLFLHNIGELDGEPSVERSDALISEPRRLHPADDSALAGMNAQQQLIAGMLNKANLLQILRTSSEFMDTDAGPRVKVVCRYRQFRAASKIGERLRTGETATGRSSGQGRCIQRRAG